MGNAETASARGTPGNAWQDRLAEWSVYVAALLISAVFLWMLSDLALGGIEHLSWSFLLDPPQNAGRGGGIGSILVSTVLVLLIALVVALPLGWAAAVMLSEYVSSDSRFGHTVRHSLQVLAAVPSIVFGLFGNAFFSIYLGLGFSILSGGLTLACMLLPILVSTAEAGLRALPDTYRSSAMALGMSRAATVFHVLLPAAAPALITGLLLGIGRAMAETAISRPPGTTTPQNPTNHPPLRATRRQGPAGAARPCSGRPLLST